MYLRVSERGRRSVNDAPSKLDMASSSSDANNADVTAHAAAASDEKNRSDDTKVDDESDAKQPVSDGDQKTHFPADLRSDDAPHAHAPWIVRFCASHPDFARRFWLTVAWQELQCALALFPTITAAGARDRLMQLLLPFLHLSKSDRHPHLASGLQRTVRTAAKKSSAAAQHNIEPEYAHAPEPVMVSESAHSAERSRSLSPPVPTRLSVIERSLVNSPYLKQPAPDTYTPELLRLDDGRKRGHSHPAAPPSPLAQLHLIDTKPKSPVHSPERGRSRLGAHTIEPYQLRLDLLPVSVLSAYVLAKQEDEKRRTKLMRHAEQRNQLVSQYASLYQASSSDETVPVHTRNLSELANSATIKLLPPKHPMALPKGPSVAGRSAPTGVRSAMKPGRTGATGKIYLYTAWFCDCATSFDLALMSDHCRLSQIPERTNGAPKATVTPN